MIQIYSESRTILKPLDKLEKCLNFLIIAIIINIVSANLSLGNSLTHDTWWSDAVYLWMF